MLLEIGNSVVHLLQVWSSLVLRVISLPYGLSSWKHLEQKKEKTLSSAGINQCSSCDVSVSLCSLKIWPENVDFSKQTASRKWNKVSAPLSSYNSDAKEQIAVTHCVFTESSWIHEKRGWYQKGWQTLNFHDWCNRQQGDKWGIWRWSTVKTKPNPPLPNNN